MSVPSPAVPSPTPAPTPITPSRKQPTTARSIGFTPSSATDNDWRQSPSNTPTTANGTIKGPGKTIGGFEKKSMKDLKDDKKDKEDKEKTNLAHVPCRFFKQGACTAGDTCPFSHSMPEPGKKEICQWFLKGNCKFGHKCALAHVRPGEPMSMDRKNKKDQQRETREGVSSTNNTPESKPRPTLPLGTSPDTELASPVAIRSALSSSIQSPPPSGRHSSSPMREPFGPPSAGIAAGFGRSPGQGVFASSPNRPSPLSASFSNRPPGIPGSLALKSSATVAMHSPLRPPTSASSGMFSSSYSHVHLPPNERGNTGPLSASFADTTHATLSRNIWAQSATPEEPLSPRRPILKHPRKSTEVFMDEEDEEDHGEDFLPASLNDLLTPAERARRLSRRDSNDSYPYGASPARAGFLSAQWGVNGTERLAQSAGANLGPANFLQSLWSNDGADKRRLNGDAPGQAQAPTALAGRQSLITQTKSPMSPQRFSSSISPAKDDNNLNLAYPLRPTPHPSSPSARAINEHAPGKSLPGGVATALNRLHLYNPDQQIPTPGSSAGQMETTPPLGTVPLPLKREDHDDDDGLFAMDG